MTLPTNPSGARSPQPATKRCFLCQQVLDAPTIQHLGEVEGQLRRIYFHLQCAERFADQLAADSRGARQGRGSAS